ncbi:hypothetical protein [Streptomyces sp. NPDC057253]|uniref:hypothetical protein n=1 Tax=Streptomyces sp. NPDC057253 TaxID=3346069 RepID=UPI003635DFBD
MLRPSTVMVSLSPGTSGGRPVATDGDAVDVDADSEVQASFVVAVGVEFFGGDEPGPEGGRVVRFRPLV